MDLSTTRPKIVCLCGSTRFYDMFRAANLEHTLAGEIVLSIGCDFRSDGDLATIGALGRDPEHVKRDLDELHKRKIDLADYVLVLNVGGYIGESTRAEIGYALGAGKPVQYLEPVDLVVDPDCRAGKHASCVGNPCECECHESRCSCHTLPYRLCPASTGWLPDLARNDVVKIEPAADKEPPR